MITPCLFPYGERAGCTLLHTRRNPHARKGKASCRRPLIGERVAPDREGYQRLRAGQRLLLSIEGCHIVGSGQRLAVRSKVQGRRHQILARAIPRPLSRSKPNRPLQGVHRRDRAIVA